MPSVIPPLLMISSALICYAIAHILSKRNENRYLSGKSSQLHSIFWWYMISALIWVLVAIALALIFLNFKL